MNGANCITCQQQVEPPTPRRTAWTVGDLVAALSRIEDQTRPVWAEGSSDTPRPISGLGWDGIPGGKILVETESAGGQL